MLNSWREVAEIVPTSPRGLTPVEPLYMWLINAHTLKLEEVWSENIKQYAILSHRWE